MYMYHEQFDQNSGHRILKIIVKSTVMNSVDNTLGKDDEQHKVIPDAKTISQCFKSYYSPVQPRCQIMF